MPYCCASNIKAAFVIGISLTVLHAIDTIYYFTSMDIFRIISGFVGLVSASILVFGAHTRNSKAMLIYMGSAILVIILTIVGTVIGIVNFTGANLSDFAKDYCKEYRKVNFTHRGINRYQACLDGAEQGGMVGVIVGAIIAVGFVIFIVWAIFVAKNAKKEIEAEQ